MADKHQLKFLWPHLEPNDVVVTGDFDGWNSTVHLKRTDQGFEGQVPVEWDTKVRFKFRIDGNWTTVSNYPTEVDEHGNVNNVAFTPGKPPAQANGPVPSAEAVVKEAAPTVPETAESSKAAPPPTDVEEPKAVTVDSPVKVESTPATAEPTADEVPSIPSNLDKEPASTHVPLPASKAPDAKSGKKIPPVADGAPADVARPSTPPQNASYLAVPSTPVKANGTEASVPSTPASSQPAPVSASAPVTPAGKHAFPSEGKEEGGSVRSLKEGGRHKHRLSFFEKIKAKFHHHDGEEPVKENGKKGNLFHKRSSSRI